MLFLKYALLSGILASIAFGVVGTYVVTRRITYLAGAMAHCALGGIGIALYLNHEMGINWITPTYGALISTVLSALLLGWVNVYAKEREDSIVSAIWSISMAIGLIFISKTYKYIDASSYLFGNILFSSPEDLKTIIQLDVAILALGIIFYNPFLALCFDEEFVQLRGLNIMLYRSILLIMVALTVVVLIQIVGIIMVIALIALPASSSGYFSKKIWHMMIISSLLSMCFVTAGITLSYTYNLPTGAVIVLTSGISFLCINAYRIIFKKQ